MSFDVEKARQVAEEWDESPCDNGHKLWKLLPEACDCIEDLREKLAATEIDRDIHLECALKWGQRTIEERRQLSERAEAAEARLKEVETRAEGLRAAAEAIMAQAPVSDLVSGRINLRPLREALAADSAAPSDKGPSSGETLLAPMHLRFGIVDRDTGEQGGES
jgi:hypothetical protein